MYYTKSDTEDSREIILPEHVMSANREDFIRLIERFNKTNLATLILNFEHTHMIDSAGLGFLLIARQEVHEYKKKLILKSPKRHVKKMFDVINFKSIFTVEYD